MDHDRLTVRIWGLSRPADNNLATKYLLALKDVLITPKRKRFRKPFFVEKRSGGKRRIVPAHKQLAFIHLMISQWIRRRFPKSKDYCYTGRGVIGAVKEHQKSVGGITVDLRNAFDQITEAKIRNWFGFHLRNEPGEVLETLIDLLTYEGSTPQGCISTPDVYNVMIKPVDDGLELLKKSFPIHRITRYSDNICISVSEETGFGELVRQVRKMIMGNGFDSHKAEVFGKMPIRYLGTQIGPDGLELDEEKHGEYQFLLYEAIESGIPEFYKKTVTGVLSWAKQVCGRDIPPDLLNLFYIYFQSVGRHPKGLREIYQLRMF